MTDQPLPTAGTQDVTPLVIADLQARTERGIKTYGRPLQTFNGRNAMRDLYEELLDGAQYARQWLAENETLRAEVTRLSIELRVAQDRLEVLEDRGVTP